MAKLKALSVYRQLVKVSKKHIGNGDGKMIPFGDYISEEFRRNAKLSDETGIQRKLQLAHNYTFLLQSVQRHKVSPSSCKKTILYHMYIFANWLTNQEMEIANAKIVG